MFRQIDKSQPDNRHPHGRSTLVLWAEAGRGMHNESWKFAVEIEQLGDEYFVRVIEDGRVAIRAFDRLSDAETFAESERVRVNVANVVRR
jgi:hypothetical protein